MDIVHLEKSDKRAEVCEMLSVYHKVLDTL